MGYVYRYTDLEDNIIKYVGIVWSENRTLEQRIKEHELNDYWHSDKKWKIEYLTENINTRTDAEYLESHYISLYETDKHYNIKKKGWGISSFIPDKERVWKEYKVIKSDNKVKDKTQISKLERFTTEIKYYLRQISNATWILDDIEDLKYDSKTSKEELYDWCVNVIRNGIYEIDCIANDYDISFEERALEKYMDKDTSRKAYEYFNECELLV